MPMPVVIARYLLPLTLLLGSIQSQTYLDPTAPVEDRVNDLLSRMTLEEKVGQMTQADHNAIGNPSDIQTYYMGSLLSGGGSDPAAGNAPIHWADLYDGFQSQALQTRLQIPLIYGIDAVHGHSNVTGAVIFPHNIGLGATRNPELIQEANRVTAVEIAATGIDWTFAPCIAVPRDERWGRTYEGFGETPDLAVMFAGPAIQGLQNDSLNSPTSIAACAKHYVGDGGTQMGDDQGNTVISEAELRAIHLPGYIAAIQNDVKTIMASYNSWNGQKLHGHAYLLTDVLKTELGFEGFVISDWAGIDQLPGDYSSDITNSINAGVDMVMVPNNYVEFFNSLVQLVQAGSVSVARIDDAVARILRVKFELGLFENPLTDRSLLPLIGSETHREVARQTVRESQVMLRKDDGVLPLPTEGVKILVAGEHADNIGLQCGGWTIQWAGASGEITSGTTILEGLQEVAPHVEFVYDSNGNFEDEDADYIIAVIGEQPYVEGGGDASDLTVKGSQISMVRKLKQKGLPVITMLVSGRPMIIQHVLHNSDVFLASWLPGTEADGIADVLFGDFQPTGRLPMTWPRSMSQIPINWGDAQYDPLFDYDFGIVDINDSESGSAPFLNTAMLTEDGLHIELAFNKSMTHAGNTSAQFSVLKNGGTSIGVSGFEVSELGNNMLVLTLDEASQATDVLTLAYESGNLHSADGGELLAFSSETVINIMPYVAGTLSIPGQIQAEAYSAMSGVQTEATTDSGGGENVGWIDAGDWLEYEAVVQEGGIYNITFRSAAQSNAGRLQFILNGEELFTTDFPVTGGWQNWESTSIQAQLPGGDCTIRLNTEIGGFNLNWINFELLTSTLDDEPIHTFRLIQNYPNPFNPTTTIQYGLPAAATISLIIYDVQGKVVEVLEKGYQPAGWHQVVWDGSSHHQDKASTGIYYAHLLVGDHSEVIKMVFLK